MAGPTLLLATSNPGKRTELLAFLPQGTDVLTLTDIDMVMPEEVGVTFIENATTKARFTCEMSGLLTIADDSGLEVAALHGAPGIRSARYAGEPVDDGRNRTRLLAELARRPKEDRSARFRCVVAIARPDGTVATGEGICAGTIGFAEAGVNGFGYDSLFVLPDGRTMAELDPTEKNRISHRARAYEVVAPTLTTWLAEISVGDRR